MKKAYLLYHLRWQCGALVIVPTIKIMSQYLTWDVTYSVMLAQFIGASAFWFVDKWIFRG